MSRVERTRWGSALAVGLLGLALSAGAQPALPLKTATVNVRVTKQVKCIKAPCPPVGVADASVAEKHSGTIGTGSSTKTTDAKGNATFTFKTLGTRTGRATFSTKGAPAQTVKIPKNGSLSLELRLGTAQE